MFMYYAIVQYADLPQLFHFEVIGDSQQNMLDDIQQTFGEARYPDIRIKSVVRRPIEQCKKYIVNLKMKNIQGETVIANIAKQSTSAEVLIDIIETIFDWSKFDIGLELEYKIQFIVTEDSDIGQAIRAAETTIH